MTAKPSYGVDAPGVVLGLTAGALILAAVTGINGVGGAGPWGVWLPLAGAVAMLASAGLYLHATLRGKFAVWAGLLNGLDLAGDERVLDLGCGRGAVLLAAARRLPRGHAVGVDLWRTVDQSGNAEEVTLANAAAEGVADRVELRTGDITELPFAAGSFDVVMSSLAIHNIPSEQGRRQAVDEAARVLRPGGRLVIADIRHAPAYARRLTELGLTVEERPLGWRFWFGGPWMATRLVRAVATRG